MVHKWFQDDVTGYEEIVAGSAKNNIRTRCRLILLILSTTCASLWTISTPAHCYQVLDEPPLLADIESQPSNVFGDGPLPKCLLKQPAFLDQLHKSFAVSFAQRNFPLSNVNGTTLNSLDFGKIYDERAMHADESGLRQELFQLT